MEIIFTYGYASTSLHTIHTVHVHMYISECTNVHVYMYIAMLFAISVET